MNRFRFMVFGGFAIGISILLTVTACKTRKTVPVADAVKPVVPTAILADSPDSLYAALQSGGLPATWFAARVAVDAELDKEKRSFNVNLRMRCDSLIWMSISPALGIEVARVLISPDSVKLLNRINGTYFKGGFAYLSELLQADLNFKMLQAILLGNAYLHYTVDKYILDRENGEFVLSTFKKRKMKREIEMEIPEIVTQEIWYSPDRQKVSRMEMRDYRPMRNFSVRYLAYELIDSLQVPSSFQIDAQANKSISVQMTYSRIVINKEQNIAFSIPDDYEPMR
jgi:hypothetical protein